MADATYNEDNIRSLDWKEHIRLRPGMYIGKLGDGTSPDDGIYILLKEVIDNSIDEYVMGHGNRIEVNIEDGVASVRDYGRGIPLGKVVDVVSKMNTGGKYDSKAFKKSVGLNGVGLKATNALSDEFSVYAVREGKMKKADFSLGNLVKEHNQVKTKEANGTFISYHADPAIFKKFKYRSDFIENQLWNYAYLNAGLKLIYNGKTLVSKNGLKDLLERKVNEELRRYPVIHLKGDDMEVAITHGNAYGETYFSFVNGQHTTQGGTHLNAFKQGLVEACQKHYSKAYDRKDILSSVVAAVAIKVEDPIFESQTKTKLGSTDMGPGLPTVSTFMRNFMVEHFDNFLHKNPTTAEALEKRIKQSERERKEIAGIKKLANARAKKANLHNKKLRDCRVQYNSNNKKHTDEQKLATTIFITEGDSASGSITVARDVQTQAVFSLRGKPLNCFGQTKKVVYENEEFNLLQHALNIEDGVDELRYNRVVIATDADVDGMHIRLLLLTFFLQFFPDMVEGGHLYILETPLFRVRDKQKTFYCYSEQEKQDAIKALRGKPEITRFKGLGEISPKEFSDFIGENIRLEPVVMGENTDIDKLLSYYMGKNTPDRQNFIIDNLRIELDADMDGDGTADVDQLVSEKEAKAAAEAA
ncbi:type IIA DNA topoisomerase subunit B [Neolewinella aurantiaca]|uniref:DNA topoisomerase (ATP-hydrolyzing) n=1 Tax=Neolewinella aurantiaca TaxID=2602767 RepID=A0A5C7FS68_9BACT|nr:DNA topoisomerase IV subunit B [Neolewinella aurantiaca]TXF89024.1 type IIA DNA topoisomerase subunit B [Neolewinella aurantiaca]